MRRPRIAHIVTDSVSTRLLRGQLRFIEENGLEVSVIASPGPELCRFREEEAVATLAVPMARSIRFKQDLQSLILLISALRSVRPDVVNAGTPKAALLGIVASWMLRVPVRIYMVRGLRLETVKGPLRWVLALMERLTSFCATHVVYVSKSLREVYEELGLGSQHKGVVLLEGSSRGVEVARFRRTEERVKAGLALRESLGIGSDARVIGFVGRFTRDKGIEDLVNAFLRLEEEAPDLHLLLVGRLEADDRPSPEIIERMEAHPRIHLTGPLSDVAPAYHAMDLLVLPSYREGFPNVVLEASAAGLPTIGYRSTGVRDAVVDGETGELVETGDVDGLTKAIARYAEDAALRQRQGQAAFERVKRSFEEEKVFEAIADFYFEALAAHPDTAHLVSHQKPVA